MHAEDDTYHATVVPTFFVLACHDRHVPSPVVAEYFRATIEAPLKRLVWFEHSAHNLPFEQPHEFFRS